MIEWLIAGTVIVVAVVAIILTLPFMFPPHKMAAYDRHLRSETAIRRSAMRVVGNDGLAR